MQREILTFPENDSSAHALSIRAKALMFCDPLSIALMRHIERIGRSGATALIIGETGSGKELVARHLHALSGRSGPFLAVNCGAFSESLIDAELFGHESGAFTGASQARAGWFEAANGGTLFLDEIGDLPPPLQVKLLRVLQERQVVRLGSRKPIALDVRLVAATNVDMAQAIDAQRFRADLYYRLSVARIDLPPLRERRGDILPLAEHFISVYANKMGLLLPSPPGLDAAAANALLNYAWPGNIRELENVIHYGLIVCQDGIITAADLRLVNTPNNASPTASPPHRPPGSAPAALETPEVAFAEGTVPESPWVNLENVLREFLSRKEQCLYDQLERRIVQIAYSSFNRNQVRTAKALGISRNNLRTLLKRHGFLDAGGTDVGDTIDVSETAVSGDSA